MENKLNEAQGSINDRIKILIKSLGMSARAFSHAIEVSESTTRNYLDKGSKPSTDYIERIAVSFSSVNLVWLITGQGEPLIGDATAQSQTNISGDKNNVATGKGGKATTNNYGLSDCEKERDALKTQLQIAQNENQSLRNELARADKLATSQQEMLDFLRGGLNRPN